MTRGNIWKKRGEFLMDRKKIVGVLVPFLLILSAGAVFGQYKHDHGAISAPKPSGRETARESVQSATVEGLKVTFEVMNMGEHMKHMAKEKTAAHGETQHSQSHMLMVTLQDTVSKEIIADARVSFSILGPSGQKENGKMEWSGDNYGGGFSPREKGTYQVELKIESGGMEREAKLSYEFK
jgi:hypothetical protein